ncbi:hypothetical protein CVT25_009822 [Psilocybe cyanescens]|uniref:Nephrocystin 3-like N-terminal domain-containing protein n=1 Tax=Psilocybe cyanescens TaxID=93625 RepID=A0A409X838_PSICY|nr:hypothetical protein CVT25_009822 [Psilocybe cyanescens]
MAGGQPVQDTCQTGNISMYSTPRNISISGGTHTLVNGSSYTLHNVTTDRQWIKDLQNHTAPGAFHNSGERYDAPKCHPDTRVAVIKDIMDWVRDPNRVEQFLWIYGPAGSGKSSIAQTIAELCEAEGILASDYFFSRTAPGRNRETNLIATLACQLITTIPRICVYMEAAINRDPLIFSRSLSLQLDSLILDPLNQLVASSHGSPSQDKPYPFLVIIDGLDECGKPESQRYILSSIYSALQKSAAQLVFIIASRPEQVIRDTFNGDLHSRTRSLVLDDKYLPHDDIWVCLESKFLEIRQKHPLAKYLPSDWPSSSDISYLVSKASGQFIYVSTVMKFIESPRDRPTDRLKIIRNASPPGNNVPFAELDELYKLILGSIEPSKLEQVLDIFALILTCAELDNTFLLLHGMEIVEEFLGCQDGDLTLLLSDLHSIVYIRNSGQLSLFHASLGDFFRDRNRSGDYFIDMGAYAIKLIKICAGHIVRTLEARSTNFFIIYSKSQLTVSLEISPKIHVVDSRGFFFASKAFVQLFTLANHDETLLRELSFFPIDLFIISAYPTFEMYEYFPLLLEWIHDQDIELHRVYNAHYNKFLRQRVLRWTDENRGSPAQYSVLTALTLKVKHDSESVVSFFLRKLHDAEPWGYMIPYRLALRDDFFSNSGANTDLSGTEDCICRLIKIASEPDESGRRWVDTSKYVQLAKLLFEMYKLMGFSPLDVKPGHECAEDVEDEMIGLELLSTTLDLIPNEPSLVEYLMDGDVRVLVRYGDPESKRIHPLAGSYIQEYQRSQIVPEAMNTKVVTEVMNTKVVTEAINTKVVPEAMDTKVVTEAMNTKVVPEAMNTKVVTETMNTKVVPEAVNTKAVPEAMNTKVVPKRRRRFWH